LLSRIIVSIKLWVKYNCGRMYIEHLPMLYWIPYPWYIEPPTNDTLSESEIILIPPSLKISESSSNGSYRNTDEVWWRYRISRSCDECHLYENYHLTPFLYLLSLIIYVYVNYFHLSITKYELWIPTITDIRKWNYFNTSFIEDFRK
jgi:hypothetical protein